jgi:hypothetical protein
MEAMMLKTFVTATAISALMVSGAFAQAQQSPPASPAPSATPATPPAATPGAPAAKTGGAAQFIAAQKSDQWLASKFNGTDVLGPNNEKIGDVNDVLFGKDGKIVGVIVGVGGFLGIGQKDVALDMDAFQVVPASTSSDNTGSTAGAMDDPNNVKLKVAMTKDQLKEAPAFERYKAPARTTGSTPGGTTGQRPAGSPTR